MKKMIAEARFLHEGKPIGVGEEFEASDEDADDLRAMKFARYATASHNNGVKRQYRRRDMQAEK